MNKVKYGLKNVHVAPLNEDASGNVSFGTPRNITPRFRMPVTKEPWKLRSFLTGIKPSI